MSSKEAVTLPILHVIDASASGAVWAELLGAWATIVKVTPEDRAHSGAELALVLINVRPQDQLSRPSAAAVLWLIPEGWRLREGDFEPEDQVLVKPVAPLDLRRHAQAWLAQRSLRTVDHVALLGGVRLDLLRKILSTESGYTALTDKEYDMLLCLRSAPAGLSKEDLLARVWNYQETVETRTLESHVHRLRKKIQDLGGDPEAIQTIDRGYALKTMHSAEA